MYEAYTQLFLNPSHPLRHDSSITFFMSTRHLLQWFSRHFDNVRRLQTSSDEPFLLMAAVLNKKSAERLSV